MRCRAVGIVKAVGLGVALLWMSLVFLRSDLSVLQLFHADREGCLFPVLNEHGKVVIQIMPDCLVKKEES